MSERDTQRGRGVVQNLLYDAVRTLARAVLRVVYRVRVFGAERVPAFGPLLVVANHQSHLDPPLVATSIRNRRLSFLARAGLFRFRAFGWLIEALGSVRLRESTGDAGALREIIARLGTGEAVLVFPEGSRSPDGRMQEFKRGAALLVKRGGCAVLPVAVEGCFAAWPRHRRFLRPGGGLGVMFGTPIGPEELLKDGGEAAMDRVRAEVAALRRDLRTRMGLEPEP